MSKMTRRPAARAMRIALRWAAAEFARAKCVPVTTIAAALRMKASSMSRLVEGGVGAILAIEDQREGAGIAHAENGERGEALGVGRDAGHIDALADELLADEAPERLVADAGDQRRAQAEPGRADGDIGRAAADGFGEARGILQAAADLLAVEVDRGAADGDDVERGVGHARLLGQCGVEDRK